MKKQSVLKFALILLLFVLPASFIFSQNTENKKPKEVKVSVLKVDESGKTISIDTTINITTEINTHEIKEIIQTITLELELPDSINDIIKTIDIQKSITDENSSKIDTGETKITIKVCTKKDDCKKMSTNKMIIYCDSLDVKDLNCKTKKGQKVIIMKVDSEDGKKIIKTKCDGKTIIIATEIILIDLDKEDITTLKKSGVKDIKKNKLKVEKMNFYPNPNNGKFNLSFELESKEKTTIEIYDESGKKVYSEELLDFSGKYNKEIDLSKESKGVYFIKVNQNKKSLTKKIIVT